MKYTISLFLLLLAITAYADKNKKNTQAQTVPASKSAPSNDNKEQQEFGYRSYDVRMARRGYVAPDSADIVKYGLKKGGQRDTL